MFKTWLITGTSSGIGRLLTERLLERGDRVVATLRRPEALSDLKATYGDCLQLSVFDVTNTEAMRDSVIKAFNTFAKIDVVVSNAGYGLFGAAEEATDAQIERQIATNLTGSIQFIRAVLPHLREQGGGRIVQVSSEGGQVCYPSFSLYHATKWGIEGFIESLAKEVAPFNIDFVIAEPGPTVTHFAEGLDRTSTLPCYENTPAGDLRRALASGNFSVRGDAEKTADAIIRVADAQNPPLRLALGSAAYESISRELNERVRLLEAYKNITLSTDTD